MKLEKMYEIINKRDELVANIKLLDEAIDERKGKILLVNKDIWADVIVRALNGKRLELIALRNKMDETDFENEVVL